MKITTEQCYEYGYIKESELFNLVIAEQEKFVKENNLPYETKKTLTNFNFVMKAPIRAGSEITLNVCKDNSAEKELNFITNVLDNNGQTLAICKSSFVFD